MRLPDTLDEVVHRLTDVAARAGSAPVLLEPFTSASLEVVRAAVLPDLLPIELEEFLQLGLVSPWNEPRPDVDGMLRARALRREDPRTQHWLPIGRRDKDVWYVVLGAEPMLRSPVVVWSSNALVTAAPFPSLRTLLLAYAEAMVAACDLYPDAIGALAGIDWWQAATDKGWGEEAWPLWNRLEEPLLALVAAEDEAPLWPRGCAPMSFQDDVDRAEWPSPFRRALRVS